VGLTAAELIGASDCEIEEVPVPEWKGAVHLRVLPAGEGMALSETLSALPKERQHEALYLLLGACLCNADGSRLLADDQVHELRRKSPRVLLRLQKRALELQGWVPEGAAPKAV
jgi:hypothetical protein